MMTETIQTPYGVYSGVARTETYPDGRIQSISLEDRNVILTHAGDLIPFYGAETLRRKNKASVTFHRNGMIKAVALNEQQEVMTPIGALPAELLTFYDTGEIHRVFPLDGRLSGFWSEEDERALSIPLSFDFGFTIFTAMISGLCFYKSGQIRSLTLFPNETIEVKPADYGVISVRNGFSLYESGALESLEPAGPVRLKTPIGVISAYDCTSCGINADSNSLRFDPLGRIAGLVTSSDRIFVTTKKGGCIALAAKELAGDDDTCGSTMIPLKIEFDYDGQVAVIIDYLGNPMRFNFDDAFFIYSGDPSGCNPAACGNCTLCKHE